MTNFIDLFTSLEEAKIQQALTFAKDNPMDKIILQYTQGYVDLINAFHYHYGHFSTKIETIYEAEIKDIIYLNGAVLEVDNRAITTIPASIGLLKNLKELNIHTNELTSLPPEIGQLENLETLILEFNKITSLPDEIGQLQKLRHLNLNCTFIEAFPATFKQLKLEVLYAIENSKLKTHLYEEIESMSTLKKVWLDGRTLDREGEEYVRDMLYFCDVVKFD